MKDTNFYKFFDSKHHFILNIIDILFEQNIYPVKKTDKII